MKPRSVDHVPRLRQQRMTALQPNTTTPTPAIPHDERPGRYLPGQLGRFPTVGLDEGAIKNTRGDTSPINTR